MSLGKNIGRGKSFSAKFDTESRILLKNVGKKTDRVIFRHKYQLLFSVIDTFLHFRSEKDLGRISKNFDPISFNKKYLGKKVKYL